MVEILNHPDQGQWLNSDRFLVSARKVEGGAINTTIFDMLIPVDGSIDKLLVEAQDSLDKLAPGWTVTQIWRSLYTAPVQDFSNDWQIQLPASV